MKNRRSYLLRWMFIVFFLALDFSLSYGQKKVSIDWENPSDINSFNEELDFFRNHNVSYLIVNHPLSKAKIAALDSSGISFFVKLKNEFITNDEFIINHDQYLESINTAQAYYDSSLTFSGIIAFSNSIISQDILMIGDVDFYEIKNQQIYSVTIHPTPLFIFFEPQGSLEQSLSNFKNELSKHSYFLIVDNEWFRHILTEFPHLNPILSSENGINPEGIAIPNIPAESPLIHWSILVLIALWISLVVNIKLNPGYYELIPRYFTAHRFFVDDILSYRERSAASALFLLFQHALFGGLIIYILSKVYISDIGLDALYHHLPYLGILGQNNFSLFILSSLLIFIVELIALIWIYIPNANLSHFNQVLNLFTWIFHLDFIIGTIIVVLYFAGFGPVVISILAVIYVLIWFSSFNITALNASKKLGLKRNSYLLKTIGLHTIVSFGLVMLLIYFNGWWDVLELVIRV